MSQYKVKFTEMIFTSYLSKRYLYANAGAPIGMFQMINIWI